VGNSASLTFSIRNTGTANLTGLNVSIDGANAAAFTVSTPLTSVLIAPGGSASFSVQFTPGTAGANQAALHITSNDPLNNPFNVNLTGTATVPALVVEQPTGTPLLNGATAGFGSVAVGSSSTLTFTIRNSGMANLTGLAITIDGSSGSDFSVTTGPVQPVLPSSTTSFIVRFAPGASGARSANLHLASNDPSQNPFNIVFNGVGSSVVSNPGSDSIDGALFPPGAAALLLCLMGAMGCFWISKRQSV